MNRRWGALAVVAAAAAAAPAFGAFPAPTLSLQSSFSPPSGIARSDFIDSVTSASGATAVDGNRIITVGTAGSGTSADIGVTAHRLDGTIDTSFSGDGRLVRNVAPENVEDRGIDVAVLGDHRILVLAAFGAGSSRDTAVLSLLADGTPDPSFGGGDGVVTLAARLPNVPTGFALGPGGRIAITGSSSANSATNGGTDDTLVALLGPDGAPVPFGGDPAGTVLVDRGGTGVNDLGADIAWRPGGSGPVVLGQIGAAGSTTAYLRAFTEAGDLDAGFAGDGDLELAVGEAPTVPTALIAHAGRLWMTGATRTATDTNAFLARVEGDGTSLQARQFDMRGQLIDAAQAVTSQGEALTVVEGTPTTLVVAGTVTSASSSDWAAAAFNEIDGDLAAAGFGDVAVSIPGNGGIQGVAPTPGAVVVSGPYQETITTPSSSITYTRLAEAVLPIDAEKACDLRLRVAKPLELVLRPGGSGAVDLEVTNVGTRACGGTIAAPAPYALGYAGTFGPVDTGTLNPGSSFTAAGALVGYGGALRSTDTLALTLTAVGDSDAANNMASLGVRFRYCDLDLAPAGSRAFMPDEGTRRFPLAVLNRGTEVCRKVRVGVGGDAKAGPRGRRYEVKAGRDVSDAVSAGLRKPATIGSKVRIVLRARGTGDVRAANDRLVVRPTVIGVGDSDARRPRGNAAVISGSARGGRGPAPRALRRVTRVSVAVRRLGGGCRWLAPTRAVLFRTVSQDSSKGCPRPVWLRAEGTTAWRLRTSGLPAGDYELLSRATIGAGFHEGSFSVRDGNRVAFRLAR